MVTRGALLVWLVVAAMLGAACRDAKPAPASATATAGATAEPVSTPDFRPSFTRPPVTPTPLAVDTHERVINVATGSVRLFDEEQIDLGRARTAVWIREQGGLRLETLAGQTLEHIVAADALLETSDGSTKVIRRGVGGWPEWEWFLLAGDGEEFPLGRGVLPALSPSGRIALYRYMPAPRAESGRTRDLLLFDRKAGTTQLVATGLGSDGGGDGPLRPPRWSPSGRYLSYYSELYDKPASSSQSSGWRTVDYILDTWTMQVVVLRDGERGGTDWAVGEDRIAFNRDGAAWIRDFTTGLEERVIPSVDQVFFVGPGTLLFTRTRGGDSVFFDLEARQEISRTRLAQLTSQRRGGRPAVVTYLPPCKGVVVFRGPEHDGDCIPNAIGGAWSPDGGQLALVLTRPRGESEEQGDYKRVVIRDVTAGTERVIVPDFPSDRCSTLGPQWSADGAYLVTTGTHFCGIGSRSSPLYPL
ncbi:MAG: hypothetical protein WC211_06685 [Dehalococcoidia bacterium]